MDNQSVRAKISASNDLETSPGYKLLFDPQTAGGLLAGVRPDQSAAILSKLKEAGFKARLIGEIEDISNSDIRLYVEG